MAYKKVTEQEFLQWAKNNPGQAGRINGQEVAAPVQQAQDLGFIGNLLRGITKPVRAVASMPEYLVQALSAAGRGQTELQPNQFKSIFLTPEEEMAWAGDPVKQAGKSVAGLGSFLLPGGGGSATTAGGRIGTAAGRGVLQGTVGGYGYSGEGDELRSTLTGGLTGGLVGGALQGAGEGIRALSKAKMPTKVSEPGLEMRAKAIGLDSNKLASRKGTNVSSTTQGKKVIKSYFNSMDELKLPTNTSELASESADRALQLYSDEFGKILNNADDAISLTSKDTGKLVNEIQSAFKNNPSISNNAQYQELMADLLGLGDNYSPSQLNMVREKARELINWSAQNNKGVTRRATQQIFDVLDDFFKKKVIGSGEVLSKMKDIYTVRPYFQAKAPGAGSIKVGTASTNISVPSGSLQERLPEALGKVLQGTSQTQSQLPELLQSIIGGTQRAIPAMTMTPQGQMAMPEQVQPMQTMPQQAQQQQSPINEMALIQAVLNGQISTTEAKFIMDTLGGGTATKQTETQRDYDMAADALTQAYNTLETTGGAGKLATLGGNVAGFLGATTPSSEYRAQLDTATAFLRKALIGAGQSEAELRNLNLPKPTDELAIAKQKIEALIPLLRNRAGGQINTGSSDIAALQSILGL